MRLKFVSIWCYGEIRLGLHSHSFFSSWCGSITLRVFEVNASFGSKLFALRSRNFSEFSKPHDMKKSNNSKWSHGVHYKYFFVFNEPTSFALCHRLNYICNSFKILLRIYTKQRRYDYDQLLFSRWLFSLSAFSQHLWRRHL